MEQDEYERKKIEILQNDRFDHVAYRSKEGALVKKIRAPVVKIVKVAGRDEKERDGDGGEE